MLDGALDKSPLSIYTSALSMHFTSAYTNALSVIDVPFVQGEFSAKLPNVFAGIIIIALVYQIALTLFRDQQVALLSALLTSLSPYFVEFNASAFTDSLMLLFMLASVLAIQRGYPVWSGLLLAFSIASKQQGIYYLPLIIGLLWLNHRQKPTHIDDISTSKSVGTGLKPVRIALTFMERGLGGEVLRLCFALIFGIGLLLIWDSARPETSIFALASANNSPNGLITPLADLPERLNLWAHYLSESFGAWWLSLPLLGCAIYAGFIRLAGRAEVGLKLGVEVKVRIIVLYCLAYIALHWLVNFNIYNRYLLPLIPLITVLSAQGLIRIWQYFGRNRLLATVLLVMLFAGTLGVRVEIGRNRDNPDGLIDLATFINAQPLGTIIYDHWLGWEMGYYLGAWTDKRSVYYPTAEIFGEDALTNPELAPRYLIAPENVAYQTWLTVAEAVGFEVTLAYRHNGYVAYELLLSSPELSSLVPSFVKSSFLSLDLLAGDFKR